MSETPALQRIEKPWWRSVTLWSVLLSAIGLLVRQYGAFVPVLAELWADPSVQALIGDVLASVGLVGVTWGRVRPGAGTPVTLRSPKRPPLVVSMLMAGFGLIMMGCGHTYSPALLDLQLRGVGDAGARVVAVADGDEVFTAEAPLARVGADAAFARRLCAAFPGHCAWSEPEPTDDR